MFEKVRNVVRSALGNSGAKVTRHAVGEQVQLRHLPGSKPIPFEQEDLGPRPKGDRMPIGTQTGMPISRDFKRAKWVDPRPFNDKPNMASKEWLRQRLVLGELSDLHLSEGKRLSAEFRKPIVSEEDRAKLLDIQRRQDEAWNGILANDYEAARQAVVKMRAEGVRAAALVDPNAVEESVFNDVYQKFEAKMRFYKGGFAQLGFEAYPLLRAVNLEIVRRAALLAEALEEKENSVLSKAQEALGWKHQPSPDYVAAKQCSWRLEDLPGGSPSHKGAIAGYKVKAALATYGITPD